ncbi:hypothetical protein MNBD_CHLOROFLEXI01-1963, partial [hydrothermal vent metagenome]
MAATNNADAQLMIQVVAGDNAALEKLYDQYAPTVLGVVLRIVADRAV